MSSYKNRCLSSSISYSKFIISSLVYKRKTIEVHRKFIKKCLMNFAFFCWNELSMNLKFIKMNFEKVVFFCCYELMNFDVAKTYMLGKKKVLEHSFGGDNE